MCNSISSLPVNFILRNLNYDIAQRSRPFTVEGWSVLICISSEVGKWNLDNVDLAYMLDRENGILTMWI